MFHGTDFQIEAPSLFGVHSLSSARISSHLMQSFHPPKITNSVSSDRFASRVSFDDSSRCIVSLSEFDQDFHFAQQKKILIFPMDSHSFSWCLPDGDRGGSGLRSENPILKPPRQYGILLANEVLMSHSVRILKAFRKGDWKSLAVPCILEFLERKRMKEKKTRDRRADHDLP